MANAGGPVVSRSELTAKQLRGGVAAVRERHVHVPHSERRMTEGEKTEGSGVVPPMQRAERAAKYPPADERPSLTLQSPCQRCVCSCRTEGHARKLKTPSSPYLWHNTSSSRLCRWGGGEAGRGRQAASNRVATSASLFQTCRLMLRLTRHELCLECCVSHAHAHRTRRRHDDVCRAASVPKHLCQP